jgi:hypothetical protein
VVLEITRENHFLSVKKTLEVNRGVRFAELSYEIEAKDNETSIEWTSFILHVVDGTIALNQSRLGLYDPYEKVCGQVIFKENYPETKLYTIERTNSVEFLYTNKEDSFIRIKFLVGVFDAEKMTYPEILEAYDEFLLNPQQIATNLSIMTWDYLEMIRDENVSYIVCRDRGMYPRFSNDPNFQVVYNNVQVAIFRVIEHK